MNANQLERAAYMAAHAILAADINAPQLACPGARRSHQVDAIADIIKGVFELHCSELDACTDWWAEPVEIRNQRPSRLPAAQPPVGEKILQFRAETAPHISS